MKFIIINGSSCSGKSTITKAILQQRERVFHLSYDSIKWSFPQYASGKYVDEIHVVMLSMVKTMSELKYDIVCDSGLFREWRERLIAFAVACSYEILEINLEADYATLSQRFDERVASALATPHRKISNLSKERFKELYDIYQREKNISAVTIQTDTQTADKIAADIIKLF